MKIIIIMLLVLLAVGSFVIGVIAEDDPEGLGGGTTVNAWLVALSAIFGIVVAAVWL